MRRVPAFFLWFCLVSHWVFAYASEVIEETPTQVVIREHPKTGRPYVSIVSSGSPTPKDPFTQLRKSYSRPDYRMLDPKIKSGEIPYNGPWSDRKKVYLFAASIATVGTVGASLGLATASTAAASTAASGGAGAYLAAGTAVAGGAVAGAVGATRQDPHSDDFTQASESRVLEPDLQKK
jgi:hypothetical protein